MESVNFNEAQLNSVLYTVLLQFTLKGRLNI